MQCVLYYNVYSHLWLMVVFRNLAHHYMVQKMMSKKKKLNEKGKKKNQTNQPTKETQKYPVLLINKSTNKHISFTVCKVSIWNLFSWRKKNRTEKYIFL